MNGFDFKMWLEGNYGEALTPSTVYDFYYISTASQQGLVLGDFEKDYIRRTISHIKDVYLETLAAVVYRQVMKYVDRRRHDTRDGGASFKVSDLHDGSGESNLRNLNSAMKQTYRSDMDRRNDRWIFLTEHMHQLSRTRSVDSMVFHIDRINNAIHNTGKTIFDKIPNGEAIFRAFEDAHHAPTPEFFARKVSRDIREVFPPHSSFSSIRNASRSRRVH